MEDSFQQLEQSLEVIRGQSKSRNLDPLSDFLKHVRFQQNPADNYYESLNTSDSVSINPHL
jgi:hypothetical protein